MSAAENITVLSPGAGIPRGNVSFAPPVRAPKWRKRHVFLGLSFVLLVCVPLAISAWYLWAKATDQYASTLAFSVRSEEAKPGLELLGGIAGLSGSGATDSDVLYDFLNSQHLVEELDQTLGIGERWAQPDDDPVFAYAADGRVEDLVAYWSRMVSVSFDPARGIIEVQARAFDPETALEINNAILAASTELVNQINNVARDDAVRYALDDLQRAKAQLSDARRSLTEFRVTNEIVDPSFDAEIKSNLIASLDAQLTETLIEIEILSSNTRRDDTRLSQAQTRARVLEERIATERSKRVSLNAAATGQGIAQLFSAYERLLVDVEFAEQRYQAARAQFDAALSEARRNTRYLAAHVTPTLAQTSLFPQRGLLLAIIGCAGFLIWALISLVGLSFLDRR